MSGDTCTLKPYSKDQEVLSYIKLILKCEGTPIRHSGEFSLLLHSVIVKYSIHTVPVSEKESICMPLTQFLYP